MSSEILPVNEECASRLLEEKFTSFFRKAYIDVDGVCMPECYANFADAIENMEVRDDDVWVCSFPKTGTTWTQEMVWCIANNLDFEKAKVPLYERFPFLDISAIFDLKGLTEHIPDFKAPKHMLNSVRYVESLPSPRFIKTHLPFDMLPREIRSGAKKPRIVCVSRNPKDACISYYHHCKLLEGYRGDFDEFCALFLAGKVTYGPYWKNVLGYWQKRKLDNILFIKYEEMKEDLASIIKKTANFLGKSLTKSEVETLQDHLSFESMKVNPSVNYEGIVELNNKFKIVEAEGKFMRSGKVNQWKGKMNEQMIARFDDYSENYFKHTDLTF